MLQERLEKLALTVGWALCPDLGMRDMLMEGLEAREKAYGVPVCPCVYVPPEGIPLNNVVVYHCCPCNQAPDDIENTGQCHCGLFVKSKGN